LKSPRSKSKRRSLMRQLCKRNAGVTSLSTSRVLEVLHAAAL
jgi:hypothetical protein